MEVKQNNLDFFLLDVRSDIVSAPASEMRQIILGKNINHLFVWCLQRGAAFSLVETRSHGQ